MAGPGRCPRRTRAVQAADRRGSWPDGPGPVLTTPSRTMVRCGPAADECTPTHKHPLATCESAVRELAPLVCWAPAAWPRTASLRVLYGAWPSGGTPSASRFPPVRTAWEARRPSQCCGSRRAPGHG
jgi:hypothetical protein